MCDMECWLNDGPSIHPHPFPELLEESCGQRAVGSGMSPEGLPMCLKTVGMDSHNISP